MANSLIQVAQQLANADLKFQLIYGFNGAGKTRLSREFKELVAPKSTDENEVDATRILYYNTFTEDLFYWDNDLIGDSERKLRIQPNGFTDWVLKEQGQDQNIITTFQQLTNPRLTPTFSSDYSEVTFTHQRGNADQADSIKVSKGEESCFIWSLFFNLIEQVVEVLNVPVFGDRETERYNNLKYVFIDDPVSSLDDSHLIELAVNIAELVKKSESGLKFIVTTHNPLFYNVLFNEFNRVRKTGKMRFEKLEDGTYQLTNQPNDSPFSYHLQVLADLDKATSSGQVQKYHFNFLRNLFEKTSTFLGYNKWEDLLPQDAREAYYRRIMNLSSHSKHHGEETAFIEEDDKRVLAFLLERMKTTYGFNASNNTSTAQPDVTV